MKNNLLKYSFVILAVVLAAGASAHGLDCPVWNSHCHHRPEIDPNLAVSALTLLGGALAVLRIRRKN